MLTYEWFQDIWLRLRCSKSPHGVWDELRHEYSRAFRDYHDWKHPTWCISVLDEVSALANDYAQVAFSLLAHDKVLEISRDKNADPINVQRSADWCVAQLNAGGAPIWIQESCHANVMATSRPMLPLHGDPALTADIDMSILGAPWAEYEQYMAGVEREYRFANLLTAPEWFLGRSEFLDRTLKSQLFRTDYFYERFEDRAEANMRREIEILQQRARTHSDNGGET